MNHFIPEKLIIVTMASGNLCLEITESVGRCQFPQFAEQIVAALDGLVLSRTDVVEMCLWRIQVQKCDFLLVYDDFPTMVSIEASSDGGDVLIPSIREKLISHFDSAK